MSLHKNRKPTGTFEDLVELMSILRKECPWDKKQTHESIKDLMVEEIYEAIDAIDRKDYDDLRKELGDLLLHIVFHGEMAAEKKHFNINDVIYGIQEKLIRRHPHVFDEVDVSGSEQVTRNWESIKMTEGGRKSVLEGVPETLPGLLRAQRMQEKAGAVGFDWKFWEQAWEKLEEELDEFKTRVDEQNQEEARKEFGDLLFSVVNVGRLLKIDAEDSIRLTNRKFQQRFEFIEKKLSKKELSPKNVTLEEMDKIWEESKTYEQGP
ncbi:MAG: nucleoside triphosphate pyrophosphohydrolase [Balneolales bacterium]